jgi:hypothetical protein
VRIGCWLRELQIPPLRFAPVGMTKVRVEIRFESDSLNELKDHRLQDQGGAAEAGGSVIRHNTSTKKSVYCET